MNSLQVEKALVENSTTKKNFLGVFSSDRLPSKITNYPASFVVNVDPSGEPGSHWLGFYIASPSKIEFFDSFGNPPSAFGGTLEHFTKKFKNVEYNPLPLQSNVSAVCGHYCIYFIYSKCRGLSMKEIIAPFIPKHLCNDIKIYNYVTKYFHVSARFYQ